MGKPGTTFAKPPACDGHWTPLLKAYGSAGGLVDLGLLYTTLLGACGRVWAGLMSG